MKKKDIIGLTSVIFFASILFSPAESNWGIYFFILGAVFGVVWFMMKE